MTHNEMPPVLAVMSPSDVVTVEMTEVHTWRGEFTRTQLAELLAVPVRDAVDAVTTERVDDADTWLMEHMMDAPHHRASRTYRVAEVKPGPAGGVTDS